MCFVCSPFPNTLCVVVSHFAIRLQVTFSIPFGRNDFVLFYRCILGYSETECADFPSVFSRRVAYSDSETDASVSGVALTAVPTFALKSGVEFAQFPLGHMSYHETTLAHLSAKIMSKAASLS